MLCVATSCCCSLTALIKPSACEPKPISPSAASSARLSPAASATRRRSRVWRGASIRKGSASPAVTLIPTPATSMAAAPRGWEPAPPELAPAVSASAAVSASSSSMSL